VAEPLAGSAGARSADPDAGVGYLKL